MRFHILGVALVFVLALQVALPHSATAEAPMPAAVAETRDPGQDELGCICGSAMEPAMRGPMGVVVAVLAGVLLLSPLRLWPR